MCLYELKARKAKFGFGSTIRLSTIIGLGKFMEAVQSKFTPELYNIEAQGMHQDEFRIYTDDSVVALWIRTNFTQPTT